MEDFNEAKALEYFNELSSKLSSHIYYKNEEFNSFFDEIHENEYGSIEINEETYPPSKIIFYLDNKLYLEELQAWCESCDEAEQDEFNKVLNIESNFQRIEDLLELMRNKRVVPFVGAGFTIAAGMPTWSSFLINLAEEHNLDIEEVNRLLDEDKFEDCADLIFTNVERILFDEAYNHKFRHNDPEVAGPVRYLPQLFDNGVVTTNFDSVIEKAYGTKLRPYSNPNDDWLRDLSKGTSLLYKVHGCMNGTYDRVLTKDEYDQKYGNGDIDMSLILPRFFNTISNSSSLLFLGCSLSADRIIRLLEYLKENFQPLTNHYALVQLPEDNSLKVERQRELAKANILPIWYEKGEYEQIEIFMKYLIINK